MSSEPAYQPISCIFYDLLEDAATRQKTVTLVWQNKDGGQEVWHGTIKTFIIKQGAEYLVLTDGRQLRLDQLHSLNGQKLQDYC